MDTYNYRNCTFDSQKKSRKMQAQETLELVPSSNDSASEKDEIVVCTRQGRYNKSHEDGLVS